MIAERDEMFGLFGTKTIRLKVEGMTCEGCTKGVQRILNGVKGVRKVAVDLETKIAEVSGRDLDVSQLIKAVDDSGYKATASR
jgi:copper chaperone CopZ